jgi:hypothetical protein
VRLAERSIFADVNDNQVEMMLNERRVEKEMTNFRQQINGFGQQFSQWDSVQKNMLQSSAELGHVQDWARHLNNKMDEVGVILSAAEGSMASSSSDT